MSRLRASTIHPVLQFQSLIPTCLPNTSLSMSCLNLQVTMSITKPLVFSSLLTYISVFPCVLSPFDQSQSLHESAKRGGMIHLLGTKILPQIQPISISTEQETYYLNCYNTLLVVSLSQAFQYIVLLNKYSLSTNFIKPGI